jgi:hypothetical protein
MPLLVVCPLLPTYEAPDTSNNSAGHMICRGCLDEFDKSAKFKHYYASTDMDSPTIVNPGYHCINCYPYHNEPNPSPPSMEAVRASLVSDHRSS